MHSNKSQLNSVSKILNRLDDRSTSNSQDDDDDDDEYDSSSNTLQELREKNTLQNLIEAKKKRYVNANALGISSTSTTQPTANTSSRIGEPSSSKEASDIEDIWKNNSTECRPASPNYVLSQFGKKTSKAIIKKLVEHDDQPSGCPSSSASTKVQMKYAVAPFKLPKTNMTRLEVAFQSSERQRLVKAATAEAMAAKCSRNSANDTDEDKTSSDSSRDSDQVKGHMEFVRRSSTNSGDKPMSRLAGGADKNANTSSSSVSDADTLVGDDSLTTLASKRSSTTRVELV